VRFSRQGVRVYLIEMFHELSQDERYDQKKLGEEFRRDVLLTFDNALLYNDEEDEIWRLAKKLKVSCMDG
jgi:hypothetical protein